MIPGSQSFFTVTVLGLLVLATSPVTSGPISGAAAIVACNKALVAATPVTAVAPPAVILAYTNCMAVATALYFIPLPP